MKKVFTLIAMAMMAIGVNAQTDLGPTSTFVQQNQDGQSAPGMFVYVRSFEQAVEAGNPTLVDASKEATADNFADWDSQFFINFGEENALADGDKIQLKLSVKADNAQAIATQCHNQPGGYIHWYAVGDINATTEWTDFVSAEVPVEGAGGWQIAAAGTYTIAFNLAKGGENNVYFKDIQVLVTKAATGITQVINATPSTGVRYNLSGQVVDEAYKGVIIQDGKKMINK